MSNKTPPAWAIKAAKKYYSLQTEDATTINNLAIVIAAHAPDAESLALALEELKHIAWEMPNNVSGLAAMQKCIAKVDAALATYRAAHPKVTP